MNKNPFKTFAKGLSLLLLFTTSAFASEQYTEHAAQTEMLTEMMNLSPENGNRILTKNLEDSSAILARRRRRANRVSQEERSAQDAAGPFAARDALREFITVSTGIKDLTFSSFVSSVPFDTVEKTSPSSKNKLTLSSPGVRIGNSGTYLVMYSMCGNFRNANGPGLVTPNIAALYPSTSPPNSLSTGQGVIGWLNSETLNTAGQTLQMLGSSGVSNTFIANFSGGDVLELQLNNTSPVDPIEVFEGGATSPATGPAFSMTVIRLY
ncbi:MAG: hypothetical protein KR126chlam1_00535 [Chlamydiae bacterium]|nr:hypothetical protein [Chlamydiota bacterium]